MILTQFLLDIIFPPLCFGCGEYLRNRGDKKLRLCGECSQKLGFLPGFLCPVCFRRLPAGTPMETAPLCHWDLLFALGAPFQFENSAVRGLIHTLKYGKVGAAAELLASPLADYLEKSIGDSGVKMENSVIVPVPLHRERERKRGFNQALVISNLVVEKSERFRQIPVLSDALTRKRPTPSQTAMKNREEREKNVLGSFEARKPELVSGKNVFLVDDVFTSGATMREAGRVLKSAGAKKIIALAAARA